MMFSEKSVSELAGGELFELIEEHVQRAELHGVATRTHRIGWYGALLASLLREHESLFCEPGTEIPESSFSRLMEDIVEYLRELVRQVSRPV